MIDRREVLWACLALLLLSPGCRPPVVQDMRAADEAAIRELDAQWSATAAGNNLDGTVSYYSDDAVLLPPNAPMASDKAAIRASWAEMLSPGNSVAWQVSKVEVARSGDLAYLYGVYQASTVGGKDRGKMVEVWKKQADGKWKVVADIYNSDLPASPAPAVKK